MKDMLKSSLPIIVATLFINLGASYLTVYRVVPLMDQRLTSVELRMDQLVRDLGQVRDNYTELERRAEWMIYHDKRVETLEKAFSLLSEQTRDRYTRSEAEKDNEALRFRIENHTH